MARWRFAKKIFYILKGDDNIRCITDVTDKRCNLGIEKECKSLPYFTGFQMKKLDKDRFRKTMLGSGNKNLLDGC